MAKKTGSQVTDVLGVEVELIGGTLVPRRAALKIIQHKLRVTDREARAATSSYSAEGWTLPRGGINDAFSDVASLTNRVLVHADAPYEARIKNGRLGGRPKISGQE